MGRLSGRSGRWPFKFASQGLAGAEKQDFDVRLGFAHYPGDFNHAQVLRISQPQGLKLRRAEAQPGQAPETLTFLRTGKDFGGVIEIGGLRRRGLGGGLSGAVVVNALAAGDCEQPARKGPPGSYCPMAWKARTNVSWVTSRASASPVQEWLTNP